MHLELRARSRQLRNRALAFLGGKLKATILLRMHFNERPDTSAFTLQVGNNCSTLGS